MRVSQAKTWDRDKHGCVAVGQRGRGRGRPGLFASGVIGNKVIYIESSPLMP